MKTWSAQQLAIFDEFRTGTENLCVRARAGCGKTTTIVEGIEHAPEKNILLAAFGKKIAVELGSRLKNPRAEAATTHSIGFAFVRRFWERTSFAQGRDDREQALARRVCGSSAPDAILRLVGKLCTQGRQMAPLATDWETLLPIAEEHDLLPDAEWCEDGFDEDFVCRHALDAMVLAAKERPATGIDYADMIYLPVRNGWLRPKFDLVVIDECQDLNAAQLLIARGVSSGRVVVVGDDRQAIYRFRGADSGSLDRLRTELNAKELPLTVTYRCGKAIVAAAQKIVPDFKAFEGNGAGAIDSCSIEKLYDRVQPGDFVLSRKNAPLVSVALRILRSGKRCKIEGKDIGAGLRALIKKLATGKAKSSMPEFLSKLSAWESREVARAEKAKNSESRVQAIRDRAETLLALADGLSSVRELQTRCDDLFAETAGSRNMVVCSSVHRAKGLEADTVYLLTDTLVLGDSRPVEEANIEYVAITRAKNLLVWVEGLPE
jgi:superfamily I DNA/RNA helicase